MDETVLLIDDDQDNVTYLSTILLRAGYRVLRAEDGEEGRHRIEKDRPDLVLLNILIPRIGGWTLLREQAALPEDRAVPIIVLGGVERRLGVDLEKVLGPGYFESRPTFRGYWEKPVHPDRLLQLVREVLLQGGPQPGL